MRLLHPSPRLLAVELAVGGALLAALIGIGLLGVGQWLLSVLPAAYPCGETYQHHPSCRLADPDGVRSAVLLMIGGPAAAAAAALALGAVAALRRLHPVVPPALALPVALIAFLTGRSELLVALRDTVPW